MARLLHDFNTEFCEPTPDVEVLTARLRDLLSKDEILVLLVGEGPYGLALLRFRPSLWSETLEAHLEELYVVPDRRGQGLGRALMDEAMDAARAAGASRMDLGTSVSDIAARELYESSGFTNHERLPDGPSMLMYERDL